MHAGAGLLDGRDLVGQLLLDARRDSAVLEFALIVGLLKVGRKRKRAAFALCGLDENPPAHAGNDGLADRQA